MRLALEIELLYSMRKMSNLISKESLGTAESDSAMSMTARSRSYCSTVLCTVCALCLGFRSQKCSQFKKSNPSGPVRTNKYFKFFPR